MSMGMLISADDIHPLPTGCSAFAISYQPWYTLLDKFRYYVICMNNFLICDSAEVSTLPCDAKYTIHTVYTEDKMQSGAEIAKCMPSNYWTANTLYSFHRVCGC